MLEPDLNRISLDHERPLWGKDVSFAAASHQISMHSTWVLQS